MRKLGICVAVAAVALGTACSSVVTGTATSGDGPAGAAAAGGGCGAVAFPTGVTGTVAVEAGPTTCPDAMAVVDRHLNDPALERVGNTAATSFDGWTCVSPTAVSAEESGTSVECDHTDGSAVVVRVGGGAPEPVGGGGPTGGGTPASDGSPCTLKAIARDTGKPYQGDNAPRCYPGWAYVHWGFLGDSQSVVRKVEGTWTHYSAFPSTICRDRARADGVPEPELRSFPDTCPGTPPAGGDLGLSQPMTVPDCDGTGIVVLYSAVTPGSYEREVQAALDRFPGSRYLRTDQACPSLRQRSEAGNPIYAVFTHGGRTHGELCAAVRAQGGDAYGRWLDRTSDPRDFVTC